jgi:hypothetical protein
MLRKIIAVFCILPLIFLLFGCSDEVSSQDLSPTPASNNGIVSLEIVKDSLTYRGLELLFTNLTEKEITYDMTYKVEQKTDDGWVWINQNQEFNALGGILKAQTSNTKTVVFEDDLEVGTYRIIKEFNYGSNQFECAVEFTLTQGKY